MEWLAPFAVSSSGVVLAIAYQRTPGARRYALGRVSVALAPAAHGQVGHRIVVRAAGGGRRRGRHRRGHGGLLGFVSLQLLVRVQNEQIGARLVAFQRFVRIRFLVRFGAGEAGRRAGGGAGGGAAGGGGGGGRVRWRGREVQPVEYYLQVGGRHPGLEDGAVVEVDGAGPALERAERDPRRRRPGPVEPVRVGAQGLLLVGLGDDHPVGAAVHLATLSRVELERLPRLAVVHALVNGYRVRFGRFRAELQVDVRQLVLLAQRQGERHVVGRRQGGRRVHRLRGQRLGPPARGVVRVVRVGQVGGRVAALGLRVVARVTDALGRGARLAVPLGAVDAARAGRLHVTAVSGVDEVGHAPAGPVAVVAQVRRSVRLVGGGGGRPRDDRETRDDGDAHHHRHVIFIRFSRRSSLSRARIQRCRCCRVVTETIYSRIQRDTRRAQPI